MAVSSILVPTSMTGRLDEAEAAFRTALTIDPYDPAVSTNLARLLGARSSAHRALSGADPQVTIGSPVVSQNGFESNVRIFSP